MAMNNALTPRTRQEIERAPLLQTRRPIPLVSLTTSYQTILTARDDADFLVEALWVAEWSGTARTYSVSLVPPAGSPGTANTIAFQCALPAYQTDIVIGGYGLLVQPGYTLQALASAGNAVNIYGHGFDMIGTEGLQ